METLRLPPNVAVHLLPEIQVLEVGLVLQVVHPAQHADYLGIEGVLGGGHGGQEGDTGFVRESQGEQEGVWLERLPF